MTPNGGTHHLPSLSDTLMDLNNPPEGTHITAPDPKPAEPPSQLLQNDTFMRCPLPPIWTSNPDSIRQFYVGGRVPQTRIYTNK